MSGLTYKDAGVDINAADDFIHKIKPLIKQTERSEVLGGIGGFGGLFQPQLRKMKDPVLVSATDGVGTKLMLADLLEKYDSVGIDLVAMCVNDIVVTGAEPLFFLDYIACGKLDKEKLYRIVRGIARGCRDAGCALIGGETAELPGLYTGGKLDLAGFCVGLIDRDKVIDGTSVKAGDRVIGLASSGFHSNGYSLVRKAFSPDELRGTLGRLVLRPTRIYVKPLLRAMKKIRIKALAHITGGGFYDNIPRVLPEDIGVRIDKRTWTVPPLFRKLQKKGGISEREMFRTFNMGIGMVVVVGPRSASGALTCFKELGIPAWDIGVLVPGSGEVEMTG